MPIEITACNNEHATYNMETAKLLSTFTVDGYFDGYIDYNDVIEEP